MVVMQIQDYFCAMLRYVFIILLIIPIDGFGQRPSEHANSSIKGSISGMLIDSISNLPVEYAAIGILSAATDKVVNGTLTDVKGNFRISELPVGEYKIQISFIGYAVSTVRNISLTPARPDYAAGVIEITPETELLNEVLISGEAALIEARPDKIIYNAERDVTSAGGDASDVLRKVPLLSVDFDGNVSLRGSENVQILINGRPSGMFSSNVADALKMLPADQIKSVEVITSPSAKFDGEGTAGIINIITRKKNIEGFTGSADITAGTRANRANGSMNYGKGRFGVNFSGGGHYNNPQTGETSFRREENLNGTNSILSQEGTSRSSRLGYRMNAGLEYNINSFNTINSTISLRGYNSENYNDVLSEYLKSGVIEDSYSRVSDGNSSRAGWEYELDYKKTFTTEGQELSFTFEYDHDDNASDFSYNQLYSFPQSFDELVQENLNQNKQDEISVQTDYVHPFDEQFKLETGLKGTFRQINSDFNFNNFNSDLNLFVEDPERSDIFFYDQNVYAGYASASLQLGEKTNLISGIRLELTDIDGRFERFNSPFNNHYLSFLPNVTISRKTGKFNLIKASYNQRIQRPGIRHVNPFIEYNDNRDISYGNPLLFPELIHQVELGTTLFIKGNMLNISVFGRRTDDLIENLLTINDDGISESTYYNFGQRSALGVNVFGSLNVGKNLSLRGGVDVNTWKTDGDFDGEFLVNSGYDYNARLNLTWTVNKTLKLEGFTFLRSPTFTVQGRNPNWSMMSFGLKKELFKKRMTIGLNITEPFRENQIMIREIEGTGFYQYSRSVRPVRSLGINIGYRFGKLDFKERSGKRRGNNDDIKPEEGEQFQGGNH